MRLTEHEYQVLLSRRKAKSIKSYKLERDLTSKSKRALENQKRKKDESKAIYRIVVIQRRHRDVDLDNVYAKHELDELVRAGYLPDDSSKYVAELSKRVERVNSEEEEETIIEIWREC